MNKTCDTCYFFEPTPDNIPYVGTCENTDCLTARDWSHCTSIDILEDELRLAERCEHYRKNEPPKKD